MGGVMRIPDRTRGANDHRLKTEENRTYPHKGGQKLLEDSGGI